MELPISTKDLLMRLAAHPKFCLSHGEYNLEVLEQVKLHGFVAAFGQHSGVAHKSLGMYELPRFAMNEKYGDMEDFISSERNTYANFRSSPKNPLFQ